LIVTPARVLFLIVLVGTTIEVLTERFRHTLAVSRWRRKVTNHVIVVGYGTKGRGAIQTLRDSGSVTAAEIIVVDLSERALQEAQRSGLIGVFGDATRTSVLREARIEEARAVIVTCNRDDTATLVTLTARELNATVVIASAVRETENAHLLRQSGANAVIVSSEAAGRVLGLAINQPSVVAVLEDLLVAGRGLQLSERPISEAEIGGPPLLRDGQLPVAIARSGARLGFDHEQFARTQRDDIVISISSEDTPS
jgi:voltage-gated potassium channel